MYYFPIISLTPVYFDAHRGFAMGFILAGNGAGGLVLAPMISSLISKYGIRWALRALGIWNLILGLPVACIIRKRQGFGGGNTRVGLRLIKKGTFLYQVSGASLRGSGINLRIYSQAAHFCKQPETLFQCTI